MPTDPVPTTLLDFVVQQVAALAGARLVVVFDPRGDLALGEILELSDVGQVWRVTRYDGNDLAFRRDYRRSERDLIWVTCAPGACEEGPGHINLISLADVWCRADAFLDASLPGVLQQLVPGESWPAAPLWTHADILGQHLPVVVAGLRDIRRSLGPNMPLDSNVVRALALCCLCAEGEANAPLPAHVFLFRHATPGEALDTYVRLLWQVPWSERGLTLLQTQAHQSPRVEPGNTAPWYQVSPTSLAVYLYARHVARRYGVPSVANQLRGLGLLDFDPELLEPWADSVLEHWNRDRAWRGHIIELAEGEIDRDGLARIVGLLDLRTTEAAFQALLRADVPALTYSLAAHFVRLAVSDGQLGDYALRWLQHRSALSSNLPETQYTADAQALVYFLDELAGLNQRCSQAMPAASDLSQLLDWYVEAGLYDVEYAHTRAARLLLGISDSELRRVCQQYLQSLRPLILGHLDQVDRALARLITTDWKGYLQSPRLATNLLTDTVRKRRLSPTTEACLWIVVFDGMRWDTWERHVKPRLLERYELVTPVKPYLSLLPSWTEIARRGLLAGKPPAGWKGYDDNLTRDQEQLVARLMVLPPKDRRRLLRFFSGVESDRQYEQIEPSERYPYNVLIFNLSDDNLHSIRGNLEDLNGIVSQLMSNILRVLDNLVRPGDTLIVTSDHGFVELHEANALNVPDKDAWQRDTLGAAHPVRYRYVLGDAEIPGCADAVYHVLYPGYPDTYTVAVGNTWFKRAGWRGPTDRYAHGGLSFGEMAVPGAVLRPIVARRAEAVLEVAPKALEIAEGEIGTVEIRITNRGNIALSTQLEVCADTALEPVIQIADIAPGEERLTTYPVEAVYRQRADRMIVSTRQVTTKLTYVDASGKAKTQTKRVLVSVKPRTDVVEIDFGGLDDLEV